jgi:ATP-binding protein involved in chromosome partitioning
MVTVQTVRDSLKGVRAPDGKTSLAESAALSDIVVNAGRVYFSIAVDAARAQAFEGLRQSAEAAVKALPGVSGVVVSLTAERPASRPTPSAPPPPVTGARAPTAQARAAVAGVRHIVAVASGKGGVGKSTTAVNLALALARLGWRVGMLDADIYGPSIPKLLGIRGKPQLVPGEARLLQPMQGFGLKVMSIGFLVEEETPMIWRGPMVMGALQQMLREVVWGELDVLVVDMPPGTGDAQLTMAQATPLAGAVIVSTPQDLALIDARRGVAMFRRVDVPILGIVENMSYYCCPNCGHRADIFGHGGAQAEAGRLGVSFLGEIPLDPVIRERSDNGQPIVVSEPDGSHAKAYLALGAAVKAALEGAPRRAAPRIVIE